ncbi:hypothetical protein Amal_03311 [Acetobacter malorum]|uniref:Uncharacterized protein n=1 Tax=Acetobacter malorum TaxID=178901 RepID=A0A177G589_9PROT|nr:hypothetical protein Amal_03311 [Acetobacter malorum]
MEALRCLDDDEFRTGDQVMGLEQAIDRGFRDEIALFVGEPHGNFTRRQFRRLQRQINDLCTDIVRDAVPYPIGSRGFVRQGFRAARPIEIAPAVKG